MFGRLRQYPFRIYSALLLHGLLLKLRRTCYREKNLIFKVCYERARLFLFLIVRILFLTLDFRFLSSVARTMFLSRR